VSTADLGRSIDRSIVLPAHNEAELLEAAVGDLVKAMRDLDVSFEVLVVENGSTDGTFELAERIAADTPEVRVITLPVADYGAAVGRGFTESLGELVVHFDVDYVDLGFLQASPASCSRASGRRAPPTDGRSAGGCSPPASPWR
jgi:glycosyltransferase involved in cell wall biosynthesis